MKTFLLSALLLFTFSTIYARTQQPNLSLKSGAFGYYYLEDGNTVSLKEFRNMLADKPEALAAFKSGRRLAISGAVIGCFGACAFGYDIGGRIAGDKGNTGLLVGGGSVMVVGIIMELAGTSKMKRGIKLYNSNKDHACNIDFDVTSKGLTLSLIF